MGGPTKYGMRDIPLANQVFSLYFYDKFAFGVDCNQHGRYSDLLCQIGGDIFDARVGGLLTLGGQDIPLANQVFPLCFSVVFAFIFDWNQQ